MIDILVYLFLLMVKSVYGDECINECSCSSAKNYLEQYGQEFSGGLCQSTNLEFQKINLMNCATGFTLLIRDNKIQSSHGGASLEGSYFRRLNSSESIPSVCYIGGSIDCEVVIAEEEQHLSPYCASYCQFQIQESLNEMRTEHRIAIKEWSLFRNQKMELSCCKTPQDLNRYIQMGINLECAVGYEKKNKNKSLGFVSHVKGSTSCQLERKISNSLTECICTPASCTSLLEKRHFVVNGKLPKLFCANAPLQGKKWFQIYCSRGFDLYDQFGVAGSKIRYSNVAKIMMDGCEIETTPPYLYCKKR